MAGEDVIPGVGELQVGAGATTVIPLPHLPTFSGTSPTIQPGDQPLPAVVGFKLCILFKQFFSSPHSEIKDLTATKNSFLKNGFFFEKLNKRAEILCR